jgi:hypothetical protein
MDVSSWKRGFALFALSVLSFSVFALLKPKTTVVLPHLSVPDLQLSPPTDHSVGPRDREDVLVIEEARSEVQILMQVALSIIATGASLFIILAARFGPKDKHWAYATVGTILGFWLHGGLK